MRVYIGKYPGWFGPYQLADAVAAVVRLSEDRTRALAEWLDRERNWIGNLLKWYHERWQKRTIRVRIHNYDCCNADHTLALVILPVLKQLRAHSSGYGLIAMEDGPEHLRGTKDEQTGWDDKARERWEWALNEMIWAFDEIVRDDALERFVGNDRNDFDGYRAHNARVDKGTLLFGKYFRALWD